MRLWIRLPTFTTAFLNHNAEKGYLSLVKYAREQGCEWDAMTCAMAAKYGHIDALKLLCSWDCPWDARTVLYAASHGYIDIVKYATECEHGRVARLAAVRGGQLEVLEYLRSIGDDPD